MIYKSPAPTLKHEIFASTPFSKYIKLVHALVKGLTKKKKAYLPTLLFLAMLPQTQIFFLGLTCLQINLTHLFEITIQWNLSSRDTDQGTPFEHGMFPQSGVLSSPCEGIWSKGHIWSRDSFSWILRCPLKNVSLYIIRNIVTEIWTIWTNCIYWSHVLPGMTNPQILMIPWQTRILRIVSLASMTLWQISWWDGIQTCLS